MQTVPTPTFAATGIHLEPDRVTVVALERFAAVQFSMDRTWSCGRCRTSIPIGSSWWLTFRDRMREVHRAVLCHACASQFTRPA